MPDFERLIDRLREDMAHTAEERAYARGFNAGKRFARKQVAFLAGFVAAIIVLLAVSIWMMR